MGVPRGSSLYPPTSPREASASRQDLFQDTLSDDPAHAAASRHWLEPDHTGVAFGGRPSWRNCCRDLCQRLRSGGGITDLSALERRQKAQEWTSVFSDSEHESGVTTDRSEEQQMELDVQTFQLEEVAAMDVRTGDSSSTTRMKDIERRAVPMNQAAS